MRLIIVAATLILVFPFIFFTNKNSPFTETEKEKNYKADRMIEEGHAFLREGDLVVRINHDPSSQFIKNFNRKDKSYSHAGIVLFKNGYPYVYHIVNGVENPGQKLRKESLTGFCNPRKNFGYGVFRYNLDSTELKKLKRIIGEWYSREVKFD